VHVDVGDGVADAELRVPLWLGDLVADDDGVTETVGGGLRESLDVTVSAAAVMECVGRRDADDEGDAPNEEEPHESVALLEPRERKREVEGAAEMDAVMESRTVTDGVAVGTEDGLREPLADGVRTVRDGVGVVVCDLVCSSAKQGRANCSVAGEVGTPTAKTEGDHGRVSKLTEEFRNAQGALEGIAHGWLHGHPGIAPLRSSMRAWTMS
jgi:hypothetical protein